MCSRIQNGRSIFQFLVGLILIISVAADTSCALLNDNATREELSSVTEVKVSEKDPVGRVIMKMVVSEGEWSLANTTRNILEYVEILKSYDNKNIKIMLKKSIDDLADEMDSPFSFDINFQCSYVQTVQYPSYSYRYHDRTETLTMTKTVRLLISEINDNTPVFEQDEYTFTVLEGPKRNGTLNVVGIKVTDDDNSQTVNSKVEITMDKHSDIFAVKSSNVLGDNLVFISTLKELDYDAGPTEYSVTLTAKDQGDPQRSSTAQVKILVQDVDDNEPKFDYGHYTATLNIDKSEDYWPTISQDGLDAVAIYAENTFPLELTTSPKAIKAYDQDTSLNASVIYSLKQFDDVLSNVIYIDNSTGAVFLSNWTEELERRDKLFLVIKAVQENNENMFTYATLLINIVVQTRKLDSPLYFIHQVDIYDTLKVGDVVYTANATADLFQLSITGGEGLEYLEEDYIHNQLILKKKLPDIGSTFDVELTVKSILPPELSTKTKLIFTVKEYRRTGPRMFDKCIYRLNVTENAGPLTKIVQFSTPIKENVKYNIVSGNDDGVFSIDSDGNLLVMGPLDRETKSSYQLKLTSEIVYNSSRFRRAVHFNDIPEIGRDDTLLLITIDDENDNNPVIENSRPITIARNSGSSLSDFIFKIKATDKDLEPTGYPKFRIKEDSSVSNFVINRDTGEVWPIIDVTSEANFQTTFTVVAYDSAGHTDEAVVTVIHAAGDN